MLFPVENDIAVSRKNIEQTIIKTMMKMKVKIDTREN